MRAWSLCALAVVAACIPQLAPVPFTQTDSAEYAALGGVEQLELSWRRAGG